MEPNTIIELTDSVAGSVFRVDNLWLMIATALVFIMHLGFMSVEAGLTRSKNTVNILFKNLMILAIGILTYFIVGFNLMYPGFEDGDGGFFKFVGFGLSLPEGGNTSEYADYTYWTDFLFQAVFAATAATIISGAVAERIKETSFLLFSALYVAICYPIVGSWKWGGGWLDQLNTPFYDFAGSTIVHSVGGWGALITVWLLGARIGKYDDKGNPVPIPGHSMPLVAMGVMLLWLGWFGFNGGSVLSADPGLVSLVLVTTSMAAAAGIIGAAIISFSFTKKHDLTMALNGALAGLVSITAGADLMTPMQAIIIGFVGGLIVVLSVFMFDKLRMDDPVGAISVHLTCGIWGTLAIGIFGDLAGGAQFVSQLIGVGAIGAFCIVFALIFLLIIKSTIGLRIPREQEIDGMDTTEHGMTAYPNFIVNPADGTNI
jgi:ammonium transporter, Amt family